MCCVSPTHVVYIYCLLTWYIIGWLYWLQLQAQVSDNHLLLRKLQEEEGHAKEILEEELHKQIQHITHLNDSHHEVMAKITLHTNKISVRSLKVEGLCACGLLP